MKLEKSGGLPRLYPILVKEIRNKYATGNYTYEKLSNEYVVHKETIRHLIKRRTWKNI